MGKKAIERWLDEVLEKYKLDASEESRLNQEIATWREKIGFWDKYVKHLERRKRTEPQMRLVIEAVLELCKQEKNSLWEGQRKAEAKRTRGLLYGTLKDYIDELGVW